MTTQTVGKYEILSALGAGSMGTVYRAFDPTLQRTVALKMINFGWTHEVSPQELAARFRTEARAAANLNHPAIVTIFDYDDQDPAGAYIAMEYVEGGRLDYYIEQRAELHLEDAMNLMQQVLEGLDYAHVRGVIHRDIKPSNLLLTLDGAVKIADFGIAKIRSQQETLGKFRVGTPLYMAPEQYTGGTVDHRCDIHAAGAVLYELLTGSPPFTGSYAEVMYKIVHEQPKRLSGLDPRVERAFDPVVARALAKRPDKRFGSAAAFWKALRTAWQKISQRPPAPKLSAEAVALAMSRQAVAVPDGRQFGISPGRALQTTVADAIEPPARGDTLMVPGTQLSPTSPLGALPPPPDGGFRAEAPFAANRSLDAGSIAAWSRDQLAEVEQHLAHIVGPVARVLVRQAATRASSGPELYRLLSSHLYTAEERERFMLSGSRSGTGAGTGTQLALRVDATRTVATAVGLLRGPLTAEATQRASKLLARYIGPISIVLTRRAAQTAADEGQLYSMLAEKLTDEAERERFLSEARRQAWQP